MYTLPEADEPQYQWMYKDMDHHDYIKQMTGFANKQVVQLRNRKLIALW